MTARPTTPGPSSAIVIGAGLGGAGFGLAATVSLVTPNRAQLERER